jgi:hypothetical protein
MKKTIYLDNEILDDIDMSDDMKVIGCYHYYYDKSSGQEHYRLLKYFAKNIDGHIVEIGTHCGTSAVALATATEHDVITYDIGDLKENDLSHIKNLTFRLCEFTDDVDYKEKILNSKMIFIDAPHTGEFEQMCYDWLVENNYKGITIWDDIHLNEEMKIFWHGVEQNKMDVSDYGHITGTGIIFFSDDIEIGLL